MVTLAGPAEGNWRERDCLSRYVRYTSTDSGGDHSAYIEAQDASDTKPDYAITTAHARVVAQVMKVAQLVTESIDSCRFVLVCLAEQTPYPITVNVSFGTPMVF